MIDLDIYKELIEKMSDKELIAEGFGLYKSELREALEMIKIIEDEQDKRGIY